MNFKAYILKKECKNKKYIFPMLHDLDLFKIRQNVTLVTQLFILN